MVFCKCMCAGFPHLGLQCIDGNQVIAVYEAGHASRDYSALFTVQHAGLAVVTEILTTLMLSQMATLLQWNM
jgi:hypothetical protein